MSKPPHQPKVLVDVAVPVRVKLSALWATLMFLYVYGDLFGFFRQDTISDVASGNAGFIGTQVGLLVSAAIVAAPSLMIAATLLLGVRTCRLLNIVLGITYTAVIIATMPGAWFYYVFLGVIEAIVSLSIAWCAWRWPGVPASNH